MRIIYVSAFVSRVNQRHDRSLDKYIDYGKKWMVLPYPKIVFMERAVVETYLGLEGGDAHGVWYNDTTWIEYFDPTTMYFHEYAHHVQQPLDLVTQNPAKDTLEYMFVQCYKTEWMRMAIDIVDRVFPETEVTQYMWNDFGIYHMFENRGATLSDALFRDTYRNLEMRNRTRYEIALANGHDFGSVYFAGCWNSKMPVSDIYTHICWVFAGSVFSGFEAALVHLADLMRDKCIEIMTTRNTLMWEVNVWYLLCQQSPELFSFYPCNHDPSILQHF